MDSQVSMLYPYTQRDDPVELTLTWVSLVGWLAIATLQHRMTQHEFCDHISVVRYLKLERR